MRQAISDQVWGWFVVRLGVAHPTLIRILGPRAARDLRKGIQSGRFSIPDVDCLFAQAMLCMVGVAADEAADVAACPLPLRL